MTGAGLAEMVAFFGLILLLTKPLGVYMARVFEGERTLLSRVFRPLERLVYRLTGVREQQDMPWMTYGFAMLMFSVVGGLVTYALLRLQGFLPLNPQHFSGKDMTPDLAFNTAMSFMTNTNWQSYTPETTVSYFSNMVALAMHNWMSAATGIAVALAVTRGFARHSAEGLGNFYVDVTRATLYVLLPICLVYALVLVGQGVPQNFSAYVKATALEGPTQTIAQGPIASQEAIKMLGTNGGGFLNANSAHPYENPTPLSSFLQVLSIFLIPAGLTATFGKMVGSPRQGWTLFAAMALMFTVGLGICYRSEALGNPSIARLGVMTAPGQGQPGGNMEGKETRFGIAASALFATVTTDASCGAVNSMHDSFTPLGGCVPLFNLLCDETIFGGVGAGLYGMLMYVVVTVFVAGLMVGRTPEYLGKKIEQYEVRMAILAVLILAADNLFFQALATSSTVPSGAGAVTSNGGPHGFTEIMYAYSSATGNNGSAFAGLAANTPFCNVTLGLAMLVGRFLMIVPLLAMAGSLGRKRLTPTGAGTLHTDSATFALMLVAVIVVVGALEYFPAMSLGPIVEHFSMMAGKLF